MEDKYFWTFGVNSTIRIDCWNEAKTYSNTLLSYWYRFDKRGRVVLEKVSHEKHDYISPDEFAIIHKLVHEAISELKWMSKIR